VLPKISRQSSQEGSQVALFVLCEAGVEACVIERNHCFKFCRRVGMEIRGACRKIVQDRAFEFADICSFAENQRPSGVCGLYDLAGFVID